MGEFYLRDNVPGSGVHMAVNVWQVINTIEAFAGPAGWPEAEEPGRSWRGREVLLATRAGP